VVLYLQWIWVSRQNGTEWILKYMYSIWCTCPLLLSRRLIESRVTTASNPPNNELLFDVSQVVRLGLCRCHHCTANRSITLVFFIATETSLTPHLSNNSQLAGLGRGSWVGTWDSRCTHRNRRLRYIESRVEIMHCILLRLEDKDLDDHFLRDY
jgi:hypothetical protein